MAKWRSILIVAFSIVLGACGSEQTQAGSPPNGLSAEQIEHADETQPIESPSSAASSTEQDAALSQLPPELDATVIISKANASGGSDLIARALKEGTAEQTLASFDSGQMISGVSVSSSGQWLAIAVRDSEGYNVYNVAIDGSQPIQMNSQVLDLANPALFWSQDDSTIFFNSRSGNMNGIAQLDLATSQVSESLVPSSSGATAFGLSPQGLVYQEDDLLGGPGFLVKDLDSSAFRAGSNGQFAAGETALSDDTILLVHTAGAGTTNEGQITLIDITERVMVNRVLTTEPGAKMHVTLSPNNQYVAYQVAETRGVIHVLGVGDSRTTPIAIDGLDAGHTISSIRWIPDSGGIVVSAAPAAGGSGAVFYVGLDGQSVDLMTTGVVHAVIPGTNPTRENAIGIADFLTSQIREGASSVAPTDEECAALAAVYQERLAFRREVALLVAEPTDRSYTEVSREVLEPFRLATQSPDIPPSINEALSDLFEAESLLLLRVISNSAAFDSAEVTPLEDSAELVHGTAAACGTISESSIEIGSVLDVVPEPTEQEEGSAQDVFCSLLTDMLEERTKFRSLLPAEPSLQPTEFDGRAREHYYQVLLLSEEALEFWRDNQFLLANSADHILLSQGNFWAFRDAEVRVRHAYFSGLGLDVAISSFIHGRSDLEAVGIASYVERRCSAVAPSLLEDPPNFLTDQDFAEPDVCATANRVVLLRDALYDALRTVSLEEPGAQIDGLRTMLLLEAMYDPSDRSRFIDGLVPSYDGELTQSTDNPVLAMYKFDMYLTSGSTAGLAGLVDDRETAHRWIAQTCPLVDTTLLAGPGDEFEILASLQAALAER